MLGRTFSHYRIKAPLGQGGMGVVYLAEDTLLGREVAIKFPAAEGDIGELRTRLLREARAASALSHPNIAAVHDCGEYEGRPYVVMEYVPGRSLAEVLASGPLPAGEAVRVASSVAAALAEAHRRGVIHRDIKPSNIAINERGDVKVLDFGLARRLAPLALSAAVDGSIPTATIDAGVSGTPAYMAPEQIRDGEVDGGADLFSLGIVLHECLTGVRIFEGATPVETLAKVLRDDAPPPSSMSPATPPGLDAVVAKALAKDRASRYASADEMLADLRVAIATPALRRRLIPRRRVWGAAAALLAIIVVAVVAAYLLLRPPAPYEPKPEARRWFDEGVNAMRDGTYYKAAQALDRAVRADSGFTLAHAFLAEAWNELDYSDRARQEMLSALPPGAPAPRVTAAGFLQVQAIARSLVRDYAGAAAKYRELLARLPDADQPSALVDLGRAYEKADDLESALDAYITAARRQPQFAAAFLRAGIVHRRRQDFAHAEEALARAESLYRSLSNVEGTTEVLYQRSVMANQAGDFEKARALLANALATAQASGNEYQRITALLQLASVAYRRGLTDEAAQHAGEALALSRRNRLDDLTARSLLELGTVAQIRGDTREALGRFGDALEAARSFGGRRSEARARFSLASVRVDLGDIEAALQDAQAAFTFYNQNGYRIEASRCATVLMRARYKKGLYDEVRREAEAQLEAARRINRPGAAYALDVLAAIAVEQERFEDAVRYYSEELAGARTTGDKVTERWTLASYGDTLGHLRRFEQSRRTLDEAAALARAGKDATLEAWVALYGAGLSLRQSQYAAASEAAKRAPALAPLNKEIAAESARIAAESALRSGKTAEALRLSEQALAIARSAGLARAYLNALLVRGEALLKSGDAQPALADATEARAIAARGGQIESESRAARLAASAGNKP